ncbi:MAG: hypothetical protein WC670_18800 [Pseudolabrys sp.]|jgi:hypothetical protein
MQNLLRRLIRVDAIALCAVATFAVALPGQSAFAATKHKPTQVRSEALRANAQVPGTVACTVTGCQPMPTQCHAAPQGGQEPGYSVVACP